MVVICGVALCSIDVFPYCERLGFWLSPSHVKVRVRSQEGCPSKATEEAEKSFSNSKRHSYVSGATSVKGRENGKEL